MNSKNFKRLSNRLSLLNRCKLGLQLFESNNYLLCLSKDFHLDPYCVENIMTIDDECLIKGLYYSGRILKKNILMISPEYFNESDMELIKSKQLKKRAEHYLNKWVHKARKRLIYNYDLIHKNNLQIGKWYDEEESPSDKAFINKTRKLVDINKKTDWREYYTINTTIPEKKQQNNNKIEKQKNILVDKKDVKKMVKSFFQKKGICELGTLGMVSQQTGLEALSEELYRGMCDTCFNKVSREELEKNRQFILKGIQSQSVSTQTDDIITKEDQQTQTSIEEEQQELKLTNTIDKSTQCNIEVKTKVKIDRILSEIDSENYLGSPFSKRTNELETVYDEINSILKKAKKSTSNLLIETPAVTYIGYNGFNLMSEDQQKNLLEYYRQHAKSLKHIVKLRNIGLSKETETLFLNEMRLDENIINNINNLISNFQKEITQSEKNDSNNETEKFDKDFNKTIVLMSQSQETMEGHTPQEGNEQPLDLDDTLLEDLMASLSV